MKQGSLTLKVLTPDRTVLARGVDEVILRTCEGDLGILPGHEPCSVLLDYGVLRAYDGKDQVEVIAVMRGFATVRDNEVVVLSAVAERPDRIEALLEDMERQRTESKRREERFDLEITRAETALRRALVGMDISSHAILRGNEETPGGDTQ